MKTKIEGRRRNYYVATSRSRILLQSPLKTITYLTSYQAQHNKMKIFYLSMIIYIYFPFVFGIVRRHADKTGFKNRSLLSYLKNRINYCNAEIKFLTILTSSVVLLTPLTFYVKLTGSSSTPLRLVTLSLMLLVITSSVIYAFTSPAIASGYRKFRSLWAFLMTISAAINTSRAASYAESSIADLVGVKGSDLPTALARLSLIMAPVAWAISLSFMFLAIYAITLFKTTLVDTHHKTSLIKSHGAKIEKMPIKSISSGLAIPVCFAMLAVSPLSLLEATLKSEWIDTFIREQLVDASFHVSAKKCNVLNIKGALIAYLEEGKALIAIPDSRKGYHFRKLSCPAIWSNPGDLENDLIKK